MTFKITDVEGRKPALPRAPDHPANANMAIKLVKLGSQPFPEPWKSQTTTGPDGEQPTDGERHEYF